MIGRAVRIQADAAIGKPIRARGSDSGDEGASRAEARAHRAPMIRKPSPLQAGGNLGSEQSYLSARMAGGGDRAEPPVGTMLPARRSKEIRYPFARTADGRAIFIDDYVSGTVTCFGCDRPLIAKAKKPGAKRRPHFAHGVNIDVLTCNAETALHRLSKVLIQDGHHAARAAGRSYPLTWRCPSCQSEQTIDSAKHWSEVAIEVQPISKVTSDLLFVGARPFAVEIVVTHDLAPETIARYEAADVPVFVTRPTWDDVGALRYGIDATEALGTRPERCPGCREERRQAEEVQAQFEQLERDLARIPGKGDEEKATLGLHDWPPPVDRFERRLFPPVRAAVREQGRRLLRLGFDQGGTNPWVFVRKLPGGRGIVFAGLAGDEEVPLWRSVAVWVRMRLRVPEQDLERFGELVVHWLGKHGVESRERWRSQIDVMHAHARHEAIGVTPPS